MSERIWMQRGKWAQEGVPHAGWECIGVEDLGVMNRIGLFAKCARRNRFGMFTPWFIQTSKTHLNVGVFAPGTWRALSISPKRANADSNKRKRVKQNG